MENRMLRRFVSFSFLRTNFDVALLVLRIGIGINIFLKHGWEKIIYYNFMGANFFDPLHIGHYTTFNMAFFSDAICSLLILVGFGTRWCCAYCFFLIFGAWDLRHHFLYFNPPPGAPDHLAGSHGELIVVLLVALLVMFISGPGRYSIDARLMRGEKKPA
jgi:putative oxidoreductase